MTTTYLLRHGTPTVVGHDAFDCVDLPLAAAGVAQAEALAEALRGRGVGAIHCCASQSCRQTAAIIARRLRVLITEHPELRELSPGDESFADCLSRALPSWQSITSAGHTAIVVIGHAGLNRVLLGNALALPVEELFRIDQDYGCINTVERNDSRPWVRLINGTPAELPPANA